MITSATSFLFLCILAWMSYVKCKFTAHPFGNSLVDRSDDILESLREVMELETSDKNIINAVEKSKLYLNNLESVPFSVQVKAPLDSEKINQDYLFDVNELSAQLDGTCATLAAEWWNYEWCHRKEINQYHVEKVGRRVVKDPNWSLGKYKKTMIVRERPSSTNPQEKTMITKMIDYYTSGQHCDEIDEPRQSAVHIQCCDEMHYPNTISSDQYYSQAKSVIPLPRATVTEIKEPDVCSYEITVCSPIMCPRNRAAKTSKPTTTTTTSSAPASSSSSSSSSSVSSSSKQSPPLTMIMHLINSTCLSRQEDWWTYELCFNKGLRQVRYNLEQSMSTEGMVVQKQVAVNQYSLGYPQLHIYTNETALRESTKYKGRVNAEDRVNEEQRLWEKLGMMATRFIRKATEDGQDYLSLEFTNGTPCDLDRVNRSALIDIYCGSHNILTQIREDSTCHYHVKVEMVMLCQLPGFAPVKENVTILIWNPMIDIPTAEEEPSPPPTVTSTTSETIPSDTTIPETAAPSASTKTISASSLSTRLSEPTIEDIQPDTVHTAGPTAPSLHTQDQSIVSNTVDSGEGSVDHVEGEDSLMNSLRTEEQDETEVGDNFGYVGTDTFALEFDVEGNVFGGKTKQLTEEELQSEETIMKIRNQLKQLEGLIPEEMLDNAVDQILATLQDLPEDGGEMHEMVITIDASKSKQGSSEEYDDSWAVPRATRSSPSTTTSRVYRAEEDEGMIVEEVPMHATQEKVSGHEGGMKEQNEKEDSKEQEVGTEEVYELTEHVILFE